MLLAMFSFLLLPASLFGQSKIIAQKTMLEAKAHKPVFYPLFTTNTERDAEVDLALTNAVYLKLDRKQLAALNKAKSEVISFSVPINGVSKTLMLHKAKIFAPDFSVRLKDQNGTRATRAMQQGIFYRGFEIGNEYSIAALSFFDNEIGGVISIAGEAGNYNLVLNKQNPGAENENYLLFKESDVKNASAIFPLCTGELKTGAPATPHKATAAASAISCRTVSLALHADYKLYMKNSGSSAATETYLYVLFNGVATLFENDGVRLVLQEVTIHITNDFYPTESSHDILYRFGNDINTNTTADLMQIVSGHTITTSSGSTYAPLGGVAWLDVLCSTPYYYAPWETYIGPYSMINTVGNPALPAIPVYSWDISCSTHELGHNFGSPHTHSCAWNGDDTPIDGCGPTANEDYGSPGCPIGPIPSALVKGTIMSYCHLLPGIGISFSNGFGPQPAALIKSNVAEAPCLTDDYMPTLVLDQPDSIVYANSFCSNGSQLYCYDDMGDFDPYNDRLVLIITNFDIDLLDLSTVEISMKSTPAYGSNLATDGLSSLYLEDAYAHWFLANRTWTVNLNQVLPGETYYSFPFLNQDINDLQGSYPSFAGIKDSIKWVVYKTEAAASYPEIAPAGEVKLYNYGTSASAWSYSGLAYKLATIRTNLPLYGAAFAVGEKNAPAGVSATAKNAFLTIYPNPAQNELHLSGSMTPATPVRLEISDCIGKVQAVYMMSRKEQTIDIGNLPAGMYLIKCSSAQGSFTGKFTKL